eukprot:scaffold210993_cov48-Prasinocladus_malaysianus.AAC.1
MPPRPPTYNDGRPITSISDKPEHFRTYLERHRIKEVFEDAMERLVQKQLPGDPHKGETQAQGVSISQGLFRRVNPDSRVVIAMSQQSMCATFSSIAQANEAKMIAKAWTEKVHLTCHLDTPHSWVQPWTTQP